MILITFLINLIIWFKCSTFLCKVKSIYFNNKYEELYETVSHNSVLLSLIYEIVEHVGVILYFYNSNV